MVVCEPVSGLAVVGLGAVGGGKDELFAIAAQPQRQKHARVKTRKGNRKFMRMFFRLSIILTILTSLNCMKIVEMPKENEAYCILPKDLDSLGIINDYEIIKNKNNVENAYICSNNPMSGISILCGTNIIIKGKDLKSSIRTQISVTPNLEQAKQLFETDKRLGLLFKEYSREIDNSLLKVDQAYLIEAPSRFYMVLRKSNLIVTFDLEEISAKELQLREMLSSHFDKIVEKYL